ncbi:MAG: hypothetical protein U0837_03475 [Dehalococcoidia bacterium]|jgi:hypothetical protein
MSDPLNVAIEIGPKGKKVVAVARDWPGLSRGGANEERAIQRLVEYLPRYSRVAARAGLAFDPGAVSVTERYTGTGSTDFWGISFGHSEFDRQPVSSGELDRELSLLQACWADFDDIRGRVSAEMRKGPRGGGRDRDRIVLHVVACEHGWTPRPRGVKPAEEIPLSDEALRAHRENYCRAIRALHTESRTAGKWPLRYLIRHTAFHAMDHAWEMEDNDLGS